MSDVVTEECELIIADLMEYLQTVQNCQAVVRGEHKIPDLTQFPAIAILEGDDEVTEPGKRGHKRSWDIYFALFAQGEDSDDEFSALATLRLAFRQKIAEFRPLMGRRAGTIYEIGRGAPGDAGLGNYVMVQALAYRARYFEPPVG
jgi:hypothetical protein